MVERQHKKLILTSRQMMYMQLAVPRAALIRASLVRMARDNSFWICTAASHHP